MDSRDLEQIDSFLGMVRKPSLFAYYSIDPASPESAAEPVLKKRRSWAQGQQANPKYRAEALWLIKNNTLLRRVMLQERATYMAHVAQTQVQQSLQQLEPFMRGTLAGGVLTPDAEQAILAQGAVLGLSPEQISPALDALVDQLGAHRQGQPRRAAPKPVPAKQPTAPPPNTSFKDYYALLNVPAEADRETLEKAHKAKYRAARQKRDKQAVSAMYGDLDEAWRVLTDPVRRAAYDAQWRAARAGVKSSSLSSDVVEISGFLPPPTRPTSPRPAAGNKPPATPKPAAPRSAARQPVKPAAPTAPKSPARGPTSGPVSSAKRRPTPPIATPTPTMTRQTPRGGSPAPVSHSVPSTAPGTKPTGVPPRRSPPPKPEGIGGRTLGLGKSRRARRATPRLAVASAEVLSLVLGRKPETYSVVVKNIGDGKMAGRVTVDQDWVELSRSRLDPDAAEQEIELTILPGKLKPHRGTALLTIVTEHGERKTITVNAERKGVSPAVFVGGGVGLMAAVGLAVGLSTMNGESALVIYVDPSADSIEINGQRVGSGSMLELNESFPLDIPFVVRTELHGFSSDERQVVATAGERTELSVRLDPEPQVRPQDEPDATVDSAKVDQAIAVRAAALADCIQEPGELSVSAEFFLGPTGELLFLELDTEAMASQEEGACVIRQLHLVDFPGHGGRLAYVSPHPIQIKSGGG